MIASDARDALPLPSTCAASAAVLVVDDVTDWSRVSRRRLLKLTGDEAFLPDSSPGRPTLPGVLNCESIAQLSRLPYSRRAIQGKLPLFGGLDSARFRRQAVPAPPSRLKSCSVVCRRVPPRHRSGIGPAAN